MIFPRRAGKFKAGDSEQLATVAQVHGDFLPITGKKPSVELAKVTEEMKAFKAYAKIRLERMNKRQFGTRKHLDTSDPIRPSHAIGHSNNHRIHHEMAEDYISFYG